jgi:superfamily II DNA or RNA helicase
VASKHKSSQWFLKQGFFEGIKSFKEFEGRAGKLADTVEMGDALEILVEALLHLDKVLNAKDVWVVGSIPSNIRKALNLPNDSKGIDGVYEDQAGNYIPYQVKYRTDMDTLPYGEISPFLGITEKSLQDRMIFTNARKLSVDVANRTGVRSFRADKFHELTEADFKGIHAWLTDKKVEPVTRYAPLTHQREAIDKITAGLKEADRTTAVMACGTGKTLVALWAAEAQDPKTVLVLVPSLALLSQTLPDWCKQTSWGKRFRYLCVCSDTSVDREAQQDGYTYKQEDLEFSVTTDPKVVKGFLADNKDGVNVIFSTYQSAEVVAEGLKGQTVDLGIFDEAHKTTGDKEGLFAFGLSDKNIRIKKRLFLTATPRHYKLNKRDKDGDFQVVSMSDEAVYGKVSYRLPFSAAVAAGIIVPYKVIISVSLNKEVDAELLKRGSTRVRRDEIQAKWVANQIALKRAIEKTGASKIITFHSRVNLAEEFASDSARGFQEHVKGFDVFHVNGGQNAADRKALLEDFKASPRGLITNARCLTEGVDVPAVDMVAFVDPRKSKIDIAQAAGRAMRQSKATNKKLGYIVVPLFIEQKKGETEVEAFTRAGFDEVAEVLGAMLESDDDLVDTIEKMQEARGREDKFNPRQLHEKIEVIGPAINLDRLTKSIDVAILDSLGVSWDKWFGLLERYKIREGHCLVPALHKETGLKLGSWVRNQRVLKGKISQVRLKKLTDIGFVWDPVLGQWEQYISALEVFYNREGHSVVTQGHIENGLKLGTWVTNQRKNRARLSSAKKDRLNTLNFSWDPIKERWEKCFLALKKYHARTGNCRVPAGHQEDGVNLGTWVTNQRQRRSVLKSDEFQRLEKLGFTWDLNLDDWERNFAALLKFQKNRGHCFVPQKHVEEGLKLGVWVNTQRAKKESISPGRIAKLNSINFVWDPRDEHWNEHFAALTLFKRREGHCNVPQKHTENGLKLGTWVSAQRGKKKDLTNAQILALESVGFSWDPHAEIWTEHFEALSCFKKREGHCLVANKHRENGLKLGHWVNTQRTKKKRLDHDKIDRLNSIGFCWNARENQWEKYFELLNKFSDREGHVRVPPGHLEGGLKLGEWVGRQRSAKHEIPARKIERLDELNFCWDPHEENWQRFYDALSRFYLENGHTNVGRNKIVEGLRLGDWVKRQRSEKSELSVTRTRLLDSIDFCWDPTNEQWERGLRTLKSFNNREGHTRVPYGHIESGFPLGTWVGIQRKKRKRLSRDRLSRLESLNFSWDPHGERWERGYHALKIFYAREGHSTVPQNHIEDGYRLGIWVANQRKEKVRLTTERLKQLETLRFTWNPIEDQSSGFLNALVTFKAREGHCRVPPRHLENGLKLGVWVSNIRSRRDRIAPDLLNRIESMGFSWDPHSDQWNDYLDALKNFKSREGHCLVPQKHSEGELKLGIWVNNIRRRADKISQPRRKLLDTLGFIWRL